LSIYFNEESRTFHLTNGKISYLMDVMQNEQLRHFYFGKAVRNRDNYDYLIEPAYRPMACYSFEGDRSFSLEHEMQEYPSFGSGDFRKPAVQTQLKNGSRISDFRYDSYKVTPGKPVLEGLPATYCEKDDEAETLHIFLKDPVSLVRIELLYTIFAEFPVIARSVRFVNEGDSRVDLEYAMSLCLDLPDSNYEMIQLSGAWGRERHPVSRKLVPGTQGIDSTRGNSSHNHNPFLMLKRPETTENLGEAIGLSLIYSGNFLAQAEVDTWDVTRILVGINPFNFSWDLEPGASFQTPEAILVYTEEGLNDLSKHLHHLFRSRLARGKWRDQPRPILINNWEATTFDISEDKILKIAKTAHEQGIEMFVLDDGWYGRRKDDTDGLGDWNVTRDCLPNGIPGLADQIEALGMKFGIWIEPEMVNKHSDLFRKHPDWAFQVPGRRMTHGRNQYVLDFSRKEVVDEIHQMIYSLLKSAKISYIKWDMNRSITEAYSAALPPDRQGEVLHRYILGVYDLYQRLTDEFPDVLFESCASGGGRMDPGMLYYAPQNWVSDDTDAIERLRIQYGTSYCYPISSFGAHVSAVPNQQTFRKTPLRSRANVACFGTFGYEMDLNTLSEDDLKEVRREVEMVKKYRRVLQFGDFYRLISPFENDNVASWMVVSPDRKTAIVGWYKILNEVNGPYHKVKLRGLDPDCSYRINGELQMGGDELMNIGLVTSDTSAGEWRPGLMPSCDYDSRLYILESES
jgi:alpha-galactosidase